MAFSAQIKPPHCDRLGSSHKHRTKKKTRKVVLNVATWNIRTLTDNTKADRPERRTALIARELARYRVDIAALSETRLADKGQLTEPGGGYTFFWSGRSSEERREAGVGFAIKSHLLRKLAGLPEGLDERLMTLKLPLKGKNTATLISAYAPTMTNPDDIKDKFYEELDRILTAIPKSEKIILLGDFNARVGADHETWEGIVGKHGIGRCNSNGILLLRTCAAHGLSITNTMFRLPTRNKTSWMHPRSKHWHLLDYVIVRTRDRQDVCVTKAMCGADCWTDHRLIISKMNLHIKANRRPQGQKCVKRLDISKLRDQVTSANFSTDLDSRVTQTQSGQGSIEERWASFKGIVYQTALEHVGPTTRRHQDWFDENDEEIQALLAEKNRRLQSYRSDPSSASKKAAFTQSRNTVQVRLREMKDSWLSAKADEIQNYADKRDLKRFYDALKAVYGPQSSGSSPILSADGKTLLTDRQQILKRWAEHFDSVLNRPSSINEEAIARLPQAEIDYELDLPPTLPEVKRAISQMCSGKAPGPDAIAAEVYKVAGTPTLSHLTDIFQSMWSEGKIPQDFKNANIVHIYKRKGNRRSCDNHRGISLLSIAGKILARVLLNRLLGHLEQGLLPESQCGFRAGRGTVDMIFAARQLQEKCQEQHCDLYTTFVDLTKAFDTVSRDGLWKIMKKFGCPDKFTTIVKQFHDSMMVRVLDDGDVSDVFPVTNGVKQGCVLAPTLFSMMFSAMLTDAFDNSTPGICIRYRTDGRLYNLRRLQAVTKVKETVLRDFLFADDCSLNAGNEQEMQQMVDLFSKACDNFGLTISIKKTEVMHQPAPGNQYKEPLVAVKGQKLQAVDRFTYLGSTLSRTVNIDEEVNTRIFKASTAFGRLRASVWERRGISITTKLKVYNAVVLTALLYACESWTVYKRHAKQLNHFHTRCLRSILRIRWQDKISDTEVLQRAKAQSIYTMLQKAQMRWTGHVCRMPDHRIPKQLLYGELLQGKRTAGGQKKRFKDSLKASLKDFNMNTDSWELLAQDRPNWRRQIYAGAQTAENLRAAAAERKRFFRKARAVSTTNTAPTHTCPSCGRGFLAQIGLISHLRSHKTRPKS